MPLISWTEEVIRFHVLASHELCGLDREAAERKFSSHLNQEQLNKQMMDLMGYYRLAATLGVAAGSNRNSAEFKCYFSIMLYGGLENKHKRKLTNYVGALEILRTMTEAERATGWYQVY